MSKNKVAILNDIHFGVRNDSKVFLKEADKFFQNVFWPKMLEEGIGRIAILGDVMDNRKYGNYYTMAVAKKSLFSVARKYGIGINTLLGNHDIYYKNTNYVNSPLLFLSNKTHKITMNEPEHVNFGGVKVTMCPWINDKNEDKCLDFIANDDAEVLFGHFEINGFKMTKGEICKKGYDPDIFSKYKKVLSGHFHHKSKYGNIEYLGSPYEMTWDDYNEDKGFHIMDMDTLELEFVKNPSVVHKRIQYDDTNMSLSDFQNIVEDSENSFVKVDILNRTNDEMYDTFINMMNEDGAFADLKINDHTQITSLLTQEDIAELDVDDTLSIMKKYVDNVEVDGVDKSIVKKMLVDLYTEATT